MIFPQIYRASPEAFTELATRLGLDIAPLEADHISLRCHQNATAERWRRGFEQCGELLSENIINGRPICLFKLHAPVTVAHWQFTVVELPSAGERSVIRTKAGSISKLFCLGEPETLNARALALLSDEGLSQPGIFVKTSSPKGERERLPNPTLAVTDGNVTVKFHPSDYRADRRQRSVSIVSVDPDTIRATCHDGTLSEI